MTSVDGLHLAATLETLSDGQLWELVYRRIAWAESGRLREVTAYGKRRALTDDEQIKVAASLDSADRLILYRSRAMLILQERDHNVRDLLRLGA